MNASISSAPGTWPGGRALVARAVELGHRVLGEAFALDQPGALLESVDCRERMVLRARSVSAIWSIHARTVSGVRSPTRAP